MEESDMINDYTTTKRAKIEEEANYIAREEQELDFLRRGQNILHFKVSSSELEARVKTIMRIAEEAKPNEIVGMLERKTVYSVPETKPRFVRTANQAFNALSDLPMSNGFDEKSFPTVFFSHDEQEALLGKDLAEIVSSQSFSAQRKQETKLAITEAVKKTILRSAAAYCPPKLLFPGTPTLTNWDLLCRESTFTAIDVASERRRKMHRARCIARACATVVRFPRRKAKFVAHAVQAFWKECTSAQEPQLAVVLNPCASSSHPLNDSCLSAAVASGVDNMMPITQRELEFAKLLSNTSGPLALVEVEDQSERGLAFQSAYHNFVVKALVAYLAAVSGNNANVDPFLLITSEKNQPLWDIALSHLLTKRPTPQAELCCSTEDTELSSANSYNCSSLMDIFFEQKKEEEKRKKENSGEQTREGQVKSCEVSDRQKKCTFYTGKLSSTVSGENKQQIFCRATNARVKRVLEKKTPFLVLTSRQAAQCSQELASLRFETIFADDFEWDAAGRLSAVKRITFLRTSDPNLLSNERLWKWWHCTFGEKWLQELKPNLSGTEVRRMLLSMLSQSTIYLTQGMPKVKLNLRQCVTVFSEPKPVVCERTPFNLSSQTQSEYDQKKEALRQLGPNAFIDQREFLAELVFDTKVEGGARDLAQCEVLTPLMLTSRTPFVEHFSLLKQSIPVFLTEHEKVSFMVRNAWLLSRYFLYDAFLHPNHSENGIGRRALGDCVTDIIEMTFRGTLNFFRVCKTQAVTQERYTAFMNALDFFQRLSDVSPYNLGDEAFSPFWAEELERAWSPKKMRLENDFLEKEFLKNIQTTRALKYQSPFGLECIKTALIKDRSSAPLCGACSQLQSAPLMIYDRVQVVPPTENAVFSLRESCYVRRAGASSNRGNDFLRTLCRTVEQRQSQKTLIVAATCGQVAIIAQLLSEKGVRFALLPKAKEGLDFFVEKFNRERVATVLVVAAHFLSSFTLLPNVTSIITFFHCEQTFLMAKELSQMRNSSTVVTILEPRDTVLCCTGKGAPLYATEQTGFVEFLTFCDSCKTPVPRRLSSPIEHASPLANRYDDLQHAVGREKQLGDAVALLPPLVKYCKLVDFQPAEKTIKQCHLAVKVPVPPTYYLSTPTLKNAFRFAFPSSMHPLMQLSKLPVGFPAYNLGKVINPFKMFSVGEPFKLNKEEQLTPMQDYMLLMLLIIVNKVNKSLLPANRSKASSNGHIKTKSLIDEASKMVAHGFLEETTSNLPVPREEERIWSKEEDYELLDGIANHRELQLIVLILELYHPRFYPPKSQSQFLSRYQFLKKRYNEEFSKIEKSRASVTPLAMPSPVPSSTPLTAAICLEPCASTVAIQRVLTSQHNTAELEYTFIKFVKRVVAPPKSVARLELRKASRNTSEKPSVTKADDDFWSIGSGDAVQRTVHQKTSSVSVAPQPILPAIYQTARNEWNNKYKLVAFQTSQGKPCQPSQQYHQQAMQPSQPLHQQQKMLQQQQHPQSQHTLPSAQPQMPRQMPPTSQSPMYSMGVKNGIIISGVGQGFSQRDVSLPFHGQFTPRLGIDGIGSQAPISATPPEYPTMGAPHTIHGQGRPLVTMYQPHQYHQVPPNANFVNVSQQQQQFQQQQRQHQTSQQFQQPPPQPQPQQQQQPQVLPTYLQQRQAQQHYSLAPTPLQQQSQQSQQQSQQQQQQQQQQRMPMRNMAWEQSQMALHRVQQTPMGYQQTLQMNGGVPHGYIHQPSQTPSPQNPLQGYPQLSPPLQQQQQQQQQQYVQPRQMQMQAQNGMNYSNTQQMYVQQQEQQINK